MNKTKIILFWVIVAAQLSVLAFMITKQERLLAQGTKVILKCRPVDPRSLFSGDYVILTYEISRINAEKLPVKNIESFTDRQTVFVALEKDAMNPYYNAVEISSDLKKLAKRYPIVIRGTVDSAWDKEINITYGVEQYFVPQNKGRDIERNMSDVTVQVSVDKEGSSAISKLYVNNIEVVFY
jgi:uncharacterized membrane-anchored protein